MTLALGIDAGGTKLAAGLVELESGELLDRCEQSTPAGRDGQAVLDACVGLAREVAGTAQVVALGVGVPELVSPAGEITSAALWDWRDGRWRQPLALIAPVNAVSDVRAAALAESQFGAGRSFSSFLYVSVGTGISQALVVDSVVWEGARGNAVVIGAPPVEEIAGGAAMRARSGGVEAERLLASGASDPVVEEAAGALGVELARLVNALDPAAVVIGGGLGLSEAFRARVIGYMRPWIYADDTRSLEVVAAGLGRDAGVIGAALATQRA